jgi:large subunit ribosomal protein L19e
MNLLNKRILAAHVLGVGKDRLWFDMDRAEDIKAAITREDIRVLIREGVIRLKPVKGVSRSRAKQIAKQKSKGRKRGHGSRKGTAKARKPAKETWMEKIRSQRKMFNEFLESEIITKGTYSMLRLKAKGGFFRTKRHIKLYLEDKNLFVKKDGK